MTTTIPTNKAASYQDWLAYVRKTNREYRANSNFSGRKYANIHYINTFQETLLTAYEYRKETYKLSLKQNSNDHF
jgi:hypothetical protein